MANYQHISVPSDYKMLFKAVMLCALISITCAFPDQDGSGSADQNPQNSVPDYPSSLPVQALKELVDISDNSEGLFSLWKNASSLTKDGVLRKKYTQMKFKACRVFCDLPSYPFCQNVTTCLERTQLVKYYNELVIQLRIAEHLINTSISREILKKRRATVEKTERKIIELLHKSILPLLDIVVNTTSDEVNCNSTEEIINQKMLIYNNCASIQTANIFLSQTALELYNVLNAVYNSQKNNTEDGSSDASQIRMDNSDHEVEDWCILQ